MLQFSRIEWSQVRFELSRELSVAIFADIYGMCELKLYRHKFILTISDLPVYKTKQILSHIYKTFINQLHNFIF